MKEVFKSFLELECPTLPFWIDSSGISYCDGTYKIVRESSPFYVIEYVIKGQGTIIYDGQVFSPSQGDVYILKKGSTHTYYSDDKNPWIKMWFNIGGSIIEHLLQSYFLADKIVIPNCDDETLNLFKQFIDIVYQDLSDNQIFNACSVKFLELLINLNAYTKKSIDTRVQLAYHVRSILDSKVQSNISLDELSCILFYSKSYIINTFKEEFNQTPYEYLMYKKIETAKHLLTSSDFTIKYIAELLSFSDAHYFSNQFKKHMGVSPKTYRLSLSSQLP